METIISTAITAAVTLAICLISNRAQAKATEALILHRLNELERKQDTHNNLITKVTELSVHSDKNIKDVNELFRRIREIEKGD